MVARSSAEAEYRAMAHATTKLTWLQHFLQEIGFLAPSPIPLFCDNQVALHVTSNLVFIKGPNILRLIVMLSKTKYSMEIYLQHL
jgi:hypothetical protein